MSKVSIQDGPESFDVTLLEAEHPTRVVLFAVGGGGNPERHLPLLTSLAERGAAVVAPHFERLGSNAPSESELLMRARRLTLALDAVAHKHLAVVGVGHSIGAMMLLALAGGKPWMRSGQPLAIAPAPRLERLVLLAAPTGYFQGPGAMNDVHTPILAWAGTHDSMTPPEQTEFLRDALAPRVPVEVRITEGAGHFTFLNTPPPQVAEPHPNRDAFLAELAAEVGRYVMRTTVGTETHSN
ncbi:MAG: alpha/beta hydrolase family protein [Myxococcales bacterium]